MQIGDKVKHRAGGGPEMVVTERDSKGRYKCQWYDEERKDFKSRYFIREVLERTEEE